MTSEIDETKLVKAVKVETYKLEKKKNRDDGDNDDDIVEETISAGNASTPDVSQMVAVLNKRVEDLNELMKRQVNLYFKPY